MTGILSILLIVALSICACTILMSSQKTQANMQKDVAMAIPRVKDIPTSIHICIIGTFVVVAGFILLFSIRLHKAISRYKDKNDTSPRWRAPHPTSTEQSLIPNSPIMVQYEPIEDIQRSSQETPVRLPPPAYGRWRGSYRMDPELLHWRRVGDGVEGEERRSGDMAPPVYASPLRPVLVRRDEDVGGTEMEEVGRAC
jgi:hypothetical protein